MRSLLWVCVSSLLCSAVAASPAASQQGQAETTAEQADSLFDRYYAALYERRFGDAYALVRDLDFARLNSNQKALAFAMQASALLGLDKDEEAARLIGEIERLAPTEPFAHRTLIEGGLLSNNLPIAGNALDRMIARYPDAVRELPKDLVSFVLRDDEGDRERVNDERKIKLVELGYADGSPQGESLANSVIEILVRRGNFERAGALLGDIRNPAYLETMLIQRRFEPLWAKVAAQAGPTLARSREASIAKAQRDYDAAPGNNEKLWSLIDAYRHAGRLSEAIAFKSKLPADSAAMARVDEDMGWAVNNVALALHQAGRKEEADRLFELLNTAPIEKDSWRVSMKINRVELLVQDGRYSEALPLIEATAPLDMSDYADQLIRRLRYCALAGLGRTAEAQRQLPAMMAHATDAPGATVEGLLCAGDLDRAEAVALDQLAKTAEFEADFVRLLQKTPLTTDDPSVWQGEWSKLRSRPAIAAAFDRLGRDIPAQFLPPPSTR